MVWNCFAMYIYKNLCNIQPLNHHTKNPYTQAHQIAITSLVYRRLSIYYNEISNRKKQKAKHTYEKKQHGKHISILIAQRRPIVSLIIDIGTECYWLLYGLPCHTLNVSDPQPICIYADFVICLVFLSSNIALRSENLAHLFSKSLKPWTITRQSILFYLKINYLFDRKIV